MGLPLLEKCCFFFDLKTGNIVLGIINAILSFTMLVTMIVMSVDFSTLKTESSSVELDATFSGLYAVSVILVFLFLGKFLFDLFFIYGVFKERPGIIKAYYIMWIVFTLLSMFAFFRNIFYYGVGTILTELTYIAINVYVILVSHSFYVQLDTQEIV